MMSEMTMATPTPAPGGYRGQKPVGVRWDEFERRLVAFAAGRGWRPARRASRPRGPAWLTEDLTFVHFNTDGWWRHPHGFVADGIRTAIMLHPDGDEREVRIAWAWADRDGDLSRAGLSLERLGDDAPRWPYLPELRPWLLTRRPTP